MNLSTRDIVLFLAGAEAFHTMSYVVFNLDNFSPLRFFFIPLTKELNYWAIIINAVITGLLVWWAATLS